MRRPKIKLLIPIGVILLGYTVAIFVLPRLGLRMGFEAGLVLQGITVVIGYVIAGVICCIAAVQAARVLRSSPSERRFTSYTVLGTTAVITLVAAYFLALTVKAIHI